MIRISKLIPFTDSKAANFPAPMRLSDYRMIGENVTIYPANSGESYIKNGYNKNAAVYSIVSKCARKLAQVPLYHYQVKKTERKTWQEYVLLTKDSLSPESIMEAKRMRKKALENTVIDSKLSKFLMKPNRNQSRAKFLEQLYGFKLLTGEGNFWLSRGKDENNNQITNKEPLELLIIPKSQLNLVTGSDLWDISAYEIVLNGQKVPTPKDNMTMWAFPSYEPVSNTMEHLRGFSPLTAGLLALQADNEAAERLVKMNNNQGAAGLLYRKNATQTPTPEQALAIRHQVNGTINQRDAAGAIATMAGEWGYIQFGLDAQQLKLLEQTDITMTTLCNIFDVPPGLFAKDQTYENKKEDKRNFVFDNIGPAAGSLRDELNAKLIPAFGLDMEKDVLDFGILDLPEMAIDLQKQAAALKQMDWISKNEKRIASGFERVEKPELDEIPTDDMGGSLDNEMNLLNEE